MLSRGLVKLLQKFNWTQVAVLYENSSRYIGIKNEALKEFRKWGIDVLLEKALLSSRCYLLVRHQQQCDNTDVKNVTVFMKDIAREVKANAKSKLECYYGFLVSLRKLRKFFEKKSHWNPALISGIDPKTVIFIQLFDFQISKFLAGKITSRVWRKNYFKVLSNI